MNEAKWLEGEDTLRVTRPDTTEEVWSPENRERSGPSEGKRVNAALHACRIHHSQQGLGQGVGCRTHAEDSGSLQQWPV